MILAAGAAAAAALRLSYTLLAFTPCKTLGLWILSIRIAALPILLLGLLRLHPPAPLTSLDSRALTPHLPECIHARIGRECVVSI